MAKLPKFLVAWNKMWRQFKRNFSYRPELHYMRGPGPKWNQSHK
jgi:hypothetical protein